MNEKYINTAERILKTIEKIDSLRDAAMLDLMELTRNAAVDCSGKCTAYLKVAEEEFSEFYFEEAITALEKALKC